MRENKSKIWGEICYFEDEIPINEKSAFLFSCEFSLELV